MLRIFGEEVPLAARVEILNGYSAHADRHELHRWLQAVRRHGVPDGRARPHVLLVHGEPPAQDAFAEMLRADDFQVAVPAPGDRIPL